MIFVVIRGLRIRDVKRVAQAVLLLFKVMDVRPAAWKAFRGYGRRQVVVMANPTVMVEPFVREYLGSGHVLGSMELEVDRKTGRLTGFVRAPRMLVGGRKRDAVLKAVSDKSQNLNLGDRDSDHKFMVLFKV
ncbi:hypothetical protein J5N97_028109 [Dioscorea zingiberensis]|uniref:Glycerol-3-phosphate acyltransferase RAM2/GPAT1-8 HAD-like domain-containing protein n=1 Tax=Dioscorea zingiberensis TaxID=325984 RepID=A0A9D5H4G9_9LILI|nr:hypothetical protein J5N97_028109 [Dioscorea zingiberensis]